MPFLFIFRFAVHSVQSNFLKKLYSCIGGGRGSSVIIAETTKKAYYEKIITGRYNLIIG